MKLLIVVTHLLGSGHLSRALTLGKAFAAQGHQVSIASGGMPIPQLDASQVELVQLPPLRSDGVNFSRLLNHDGQLADEDYHASRRTLLIETLDRLQPDVLITELFPFGRRSLKAEFQALLDHSKQLKIPLVLGSIRDILAPPSKPKKAQFADEMVAQFYDSILVHSEPSLVPLELSWPVSETLAPKLNYTGFVAPKRPLPHPDLAGHGEIIVSAGGGDVGQKLFHTAIDAAKRDNKQKWRILVGGAQAKVQIAKMQEHASKNVVIEAARPDFRQMLNHADVSVSMCGYNTALDILQTGIPAVFIPFDAGGEVEQTLRADALAKNANITVLKDADLNAGTLLAAVSDNMTSRDRNQKSDGFDGASKTVKIVENMLKTKRQK
jgi:predicted glycosyltransferase